MTRRSILLASAALLPRVATGQGVSTRAAKPMPRGKPSGIPFHSRLTDVAVHAGLRHPVICGPAERKDYILETMGCGLAWIDYDNDGWPDLFVPSATRLDDPRAGGNRLYRNNRDGTFTDVTEKAGLARSGWASGVTVGDYNNDGWPDIFLTYYGHNVLYRNNGDGTFTDVTREAGLLRTERLWGSGCAFFDYDRDGFLDLCFATYLEFDPKTSPRPGQASNCKWKGIDVNCGPKGFPAGKVFLYRNNGDGTFRDVTAASGLSKLAGSFCLTVTPADYDDDGWPDLYIACDSTPSFLLRNNHDGTFTDLGLENGVALNEDGMEQAGMGIGIGDYEPDGALDLFKTHFVDDTNILYKNDGKGTFADVTLPAGLGVETRFTNWGAGIADLDNDGLPDIFYVTGSVYPEAEKVVPNYPAKSPRVIFRNLGNGKFEELLDAGEGQTTPHTSRGCAFADYDNDGDVDIAIVNLNEPPSLLRNDTTGARSWLNIKLTGTKSNRSGIGARATVHYGGRKQTQEVVSQSSFLSASDLRLHFGLGDVETVDVDVRWPNGARESFKNVAAKRHIEITEGKGIARQKIADRQK